MDGVKGLVEEGRALGNDVGKVCAHSDLVVGVAVVVWPRASVKAVRADNHCRHDAACLGLAVGALYERLNVRRDAEVIGVAVVTAVFREEVTLEAGELAGPPWFVIRVLGEFLLVEGNIPNENVLLVLVLDFDASIIQCWPVRLVLGQKGAVTKELVIVPVIQRVVVEKVSDMLDIVLVLPSA